MRYFALLTLLFTATISAAAPALRWDTQQANPKPADWYIYRGEAVDLMPRLVDGTKPADITDTPATLRYREPTLAPEQYRTITATNVAPGTWLIPWRADHDSGADYYDYQLWIGTGPDATARITGKLIMRDSIGIPPGGSPPPPIAGYATPADLQTASNALAAAIAAIPPPPDLAPYLRRDTVNYAAYPGFSLRGSYGHPGSFRSFYFTPIELSFEYGGTVTSRAQLRAGGLKASETEGGTTTYAEYGAGRIRTADGIYDLPSDPSGTLATKQNITSILTSSNGWLTVSNGIMSVHAVTNPATPATVVWSSAEADDQDTIPPAVTNALWSAISTINTTLGNKADKAWGKYLPDGSANPEPTWATMLNAPVTLIGSGVQWTTAGTYALLTTPGAAAVAASPEGGELRIGPDITTNFFGYRTGGSYLVGARTDGIQILNGGTTNGYAELTYDTFGDNSPPTIWFTPSLALDWSPIEPVWIDNGETATAIVPATTKTGFWRATTSLTIDAILFSTMPARLEGGIFGNPHTAPVKYDSTITINVDGKSYRIPAEEVK